MGWLEAVAGRLGNVARAYSDARHGSIENPSVPIGSWNGLDYESGSTSGMVVSDSSAMRMTAVFSAVRVLAETVSSLPLILYERSEDGGKRRAREHPLYPILHDEPNEAMSSSAFFEAGQGQAARCGNFFAFIDRDGGGRVRALWPYETGQITVEVDERQTKIMPQRRVWYRDRETGRLVPPDRMLHVLGLGDNGYIGFNPILLARESIGLGMAAEKFGARFFGSGSRPSGLLSTDGKLDTDEAKRWGAEFNAVHGGVHNTQKVAVLGGGLKFQPISINNEDAQFLETRKFQVEDIARLFRVPPHMIASLDRATFSNIEHQSIEFSLFTMRPWFVRWEREINRKLFTPEERLRYFVEFNADALLRSDTKGRYEALTKAIGGPWMTRNEGRTLENMNPIEGGDELLTPMNMTGDPGRDDPSGDAGEEAA